jgi:hypothetical protein
MTKELSTEKIESLNGLREEATRIYTELSGEVNQVKTRADYCIELAWRLGGICENAKKTAGHGHFLAWLEGAGISTDSSDRYRALNAKFRSIAELHEANAQRVGYLKLLVPDKEKVEHDGDVDLDPPVHHNCIMNVFSRFKRRLEIGKITMDKERARKDLLPVYEFLKGLFE